MFILSQDRDALIEFTPDMVLYAQLIINEGVFYGLNLMLGKDFLGTYDNLQEVMAEIWNIANCNYDYYVMGGFEDYAENFKREVQRIK